jgi:hypothetical protein
VATDAAVPHVVPSLSWLVFASPVPVTCTTQETVIGQSLNAWVNGPFSVNTPTSNEKWVLAPGM